MSISNSDAFGSAAALDDYKKIFKTTVAGPKGVTKGVAGYINYQFTPKFGTSLRLEHLNLKNDVAGTSYNLDEAMLTGTYRATSNFRLNAEVRYDRGSVPAFADGFIAGTSTPRLSKHDGEVKVSAVYSFGGI
ncbi:outer membrane beta-barrel protein [Phenylobacterium sp. LjRoot225]|uniref:outer membrane beta-barrel protein n=1 Tax=Phenylobacterium sp. LjRoot225 TaxID=3342285 RepID=UPI003ECD4E4F